MGRTKAFCTKTALFKALSQFWQYGYEATSMGDLVKAMGVSRQSIYDTYGNKESLFLSTMDLFCDVSQTLFDMHLSSDNASLPEIVKHFALTRKFQLDDNKKMSCYISNCALELGDTSSLESAKEINHEVKIKSNEYFENYRLAFKNAIENGKLKGEISSNLDSDAISWYLVNSISGLGIMNKSGTQPKQIDKIIISTLSIFDRFRQDDYDKAVIEVKGIMENSAKEMLNMLTA